MIIQWNSTSIRKNKEDLNVPCHYNCSIAAISETWLKQGTYVCISGYSIFRANREDRKGGSALIIYKNIDYTGIPINYNPDELEVVTARINDVSITSLYIPSTSTITSQWII